MKTNILTLIFAILLPSMATAQDDLYFTPDKQEKERKAESARKLKEARDAEKTKKNTRFVSKNGFAGINMSVDEYNRRAKKMLKPYTVNDSLVYSSDSVATDIITFNPSDCMVKADEQYLDTIVKIIYVHDSADFSLCRYMARFDDFLWFSRFYGPGWYTPMSWFWYDPWYDPWYWNVHFAWYGPYWYDPWSPYNHRYYWATSHYDYISNGYIPGGGGHYTPGHRGEYASRPGRGGSGGIVVRNSSGSNSYSYIANRNGGGINRFTGTNMSSARESAHRGNSRYGGNSGHTNNSNGYSGSSTYSSSSSFSSGSSYSGGSSHSGGGGGFSGGGHSNAGGSHSGGRR